MAWNTKIGKIADGDDWERYAHSFLRLRHKDDQYQEIPSRFGGDLGIESFTRANGVAYQCYLPADDYSPKQLYEHQRNKITADLRKLQSNVAQLNKLLGTTRLCEWNFLTPYFNNKDLVAHCATKAEEVKAQGLPFIDASFQVLVRTEEDYQLEISKLLNAGLNKLSTKVDHPQQDDVDAWFDSNDGRELVVAEKGRCLGHTGEGLRDFVVAQVEAYLVGQAVLGQLRSDMPELYDELFQLKLTRESRLRLTVSAAGAPGSVLEKTLENYEKELNREFSGALSAPDRGRLALEVVADWLIRCPLKFPGNSGD